MRYRQKEEILQAIGTMKEAHDYIKRQCEMQETESVYEVLVQLQEMAVRIGNLLETEVGYPQDIIAALEEYCEQIYECSMKINDCQLVMNRNEKVLEFLGKIEYAISKISAKIKVAFFPYKFSMWDSLESIWEAANRDEKCDCQIIPIPYYTKDDEDKFTRLHYEGEDFETGCSIIDYRKYNLEEEQPDIMYIHNPYDQYNAVSMVEPRFFSDELKKYGGMLVYVPYYMSGCCSKYENLDIAYGKGALNSDYIIVQSKALKEAYQYWGFPSRRILALGSPKIDAIHKLISEEQQINPEWHKKVAGKKVVLLNTSISTFLNKEGWLKEIKEWAEIILQSGMTLIWRPHPLLADAIQTLGKEQEEQFQQLTELITEAECGLIDMEADAYSAMKVSHAMISDYSSLILQYTFTGKPVLMLNVSSKNRGTYVFCDFYENYSLEDGMSVEAFADMIQKGEDSKGSERLAAAVASIENADGTCGKKVHQTMMNKLIEFYG